MNNAVNTFENSSLSLEEFKRQFAGMPLFGNNALPHWVQGDWVLEAMFLDLKDVIVTPLEECPLGGAIQLLVLRKGNIVYTREEFSFLKSALLQARNEREYLIDYEIEFTLQLRVGGVVFIEDHLWVEGKDYKISEDLFNSFFS